MNVFSIPIHLPFAKALAAHLLKAYGNDPVTFSRVLVLLPSRRACRALREALLDTTKGKPLILPRMQPLGDLSEEGLFFENILLDAGQEEKLAAILPAVSPSRRRMLLAREILDVKLPRVSESMTSAQALALADELSGLLDEVDREERSFQSLRLLYPEDYSAHWQIIMDFLAVASDRWPQILASEGVQDAVQRRSQLIHLLTNVWQQSAPSYPVIAAGSTGSIPATARLLKTIASLPQGKVILPGLDPSMPEAVWNALGGARQGKDDMSPPEHHPFAGQMRLLHYFGIKREELKILDEYSTSEAQLLRSRLFQSIFYPAECTDLWAELPSLEAAFHGVSRYECDSQHDESVLISVLLRETLETPDKTAALVTPDRSLARAVAAQMQRFGVQVDDSAGEALSVRPCAVILRLVIKMVLERFSPVSLLAVLKHPLVTFGYERNLILDASRDLERRFLRGLRLAPGLDTIINAVQKKDDISGVLLPMLLNFRKVLSPLIAALDKNSRHPITLQQLMQLHSEVVGILTDGAVWQKEDGESLRRVLDDLIDAAELFPALDTGAYPSLLDRFLSTEVYRPRYGLHPRIHILSPQEARMQYFDRVIAAGLNEGTWPTDARIDPWMSRPMRSAFGLPSHERHTGQQAHDFLSLVACAELMMTRSLKVTDSPSIPSPWLLKLHAISEFLKISHCLDVYSKVYSSIVDNMNTVPEVKPALPPMPMPTKRPDTLSATRIEALIENPYAVYARDILKLKKLEDISAEPDASDFGNVIHKILEKFVRDYPSQIDENAYTTLIKHGKALFSEFDDRPAVRTFWWPRFEAIASWLISHELMHRRKGLTVLPEVQGRWTLPLDTGDFVLTSRSDRLEIEGDTVSIIDYKTGELKSKNNVESGRSCQLQLEALITLRGTRERLEQPVTRVAGLQYWSLKPRGDEIPMRDLTKLDKSLETLLSETEQGVIALLNAYSDVEQPYLSCPHPSWKIKYNDYAQLARMGEWSADDAV